MRPSQVILVLEDLRKSFVGPLYRKGVELSSNDNQTVLDVYQQWLLLLLDLGYLHPDTLLRDSRRLLTDMVRADVLDLNNAFAELLGKVRTKNVKGFKALCRTISTHLYNLVKDDVCAVEQGDVYAARRLIQLTSYTSRLTLHDIDLTDECLIDYMRTEESFDSYVSSNLVSSLNNIIKRWMKSFDPTRMRFQHGPGGVAGHGRTSLTVKYKDLTRDSLLDYAFGDKLVTTDGITSTCDRISQTIFVPKSYKTFRTISMEPATLQYCQQGIWREIDRVVGSSRFLRDRIGFHEQERNQRLAMEGSLDRNYATIDLSAASDSVSYDLVKRVFRGTKLYRYIVATRSSRTLLPDGRLIDLKKFAPMGSALCFPIETLIFASVCHFVTREHGVNGDYSVFGDDIIVPTQCAEDIMLTLQILGFRVNREKSFFDPECWFRESCGAEFCDGFDVTPLKVSRKYNAKQLDVQATGLVDLSNECYKRGYRNLRQFFICKLRSYDLVPFFSPTELLSDNYTNYHTRRRWNPELQRIECHVSTLAVETSKNQDEDLRYRHWLETAAGRDIAPLALESIDNRAYRRQKENLISALRTGDGFSADVGRPTVLLKNRWRQKPYEEPDQPFINFFTIEG